MKRSKGAKRGVMGKMARQLSRVIQAVSPGGGAATDSKKLDDLAKQVADLKKQFDQLSRQQRIGGGVAPGNPGAPVVTSAADAASQMRGKFANTATPNSPSLSPVTPAPSQTPSALATMLARASQTGGKFGAMAQNLSTIFGGQSAAAGSAASAQSGISRMGGRVNAVMAAADAGASIAEGVANRIDNFMSGSQGQIDTIVEAAQFTPAGPFAAAMGKLYDYGKSQARGQEAAARSRLGSYNDAEDAGLLYSTPELAQKYRNQTAATAANSTSLWTRTKAYFGNEEAEAEIEAAKRQAANEPMQINSDIRKRALMIPQFSQPLVDYAQKRGMRASDLNELQREEVLNTAIDEKMDQVGKSEGAKRYIQTQIKVHDQSGATGAKLAALEQKYRMEYVRKMTVDIVDAKFKAHKLEVERFELSMTPEKRHQWHNEMLDFQAVQQAFAKRHKVKWDD